MADTFDLKQGDLDAALAAMKQADVDEGAQESIDKVTKVVAKVAQQTTLPAAPGSFSRSGIKVKPRSGARPKWAMVEMSGQKPLVKGAEWGALRSWVFVGTMKHGGIRRPGSQKRLARRQFGRHQSETKHGGYVVGRAWTLVEKSGKADETAGDEMLDEYTQSFDRHGLKKG